MVIKEREKRLDTIRKHDDMLHEVAKRYSMLRYLAEKEDASEMFLLMAESAGSLTVAHLKQTGELLSILWRALNRENDCPELEKDYWLKK